MGKSSVKLEFDVKSLQDKVKRLGKTGTAMLTNEVIKDSNYFIPYDEGELMRSAIRESIPEEGKAIWDTPYARRLYYNPQYNFNVAGEFKPGEDGNPGRWSPGNPNAGGLWFENAKAANKDKWIALIDKAIREGL